MSLSPLNALREQYERLPYPPIPWIALPRRNEGKELLYKAHEGQRILIAGCGTFEPAVIAQTHPRAREMVAVDLSESSVAIARRRIRLLRLMRPFRPLPPVDFAAGDLERLDLGKFDLIFASNLLHHVTAPAALLSRLAEMLPRGGILRMVTYPRGSRYWMRRTSTWLKSRGLSPQTPHLVRRAREAIRTLSLSHPFRSCFDSQPETGRLAGLVDAFFNACENPLSPLEWEEASRAAGFELVREAQSETSRSSFLDPALIEPGKLGVWEKLQILDDTWELCANPVFWFRKVREPAPAPARLPEPTLREQLRRADTLLRKTGTDLQQYQQWLKREIGPRVHPNHPDERLPGLSLVDYFVSADFALSPDFESEDFAPERL